MSDEPDSIYLRTSIEERLGAIYVRIWDMSLEPKDGLSRYRLDQNGLDKVRASAKELREWWDSLGPGRQDLLPGDLADKIGALCRALDEETGDG